MDKSVIVPSHYMINMEATNSNVNKSNNKVLKRIMIFMAILITLLITATCVLSVAYCVKTKNQKDKIDLLNYHLENVHRKYIKCRFGA